MASDMESRFHSLIRPEAAEATAMGIHAEVAKIQRWKVATQMDLDAKDSQMRQCETILQQQHSQLQEEQRRGQVLRESYRQKCEEVVKVQDDLRQQASVNKILEEGMLKLDATLETQEEFIRMVKALNVQKQRELEALKAKVDRLQETLDKGYADKSKENDQLAQQLSSVKDGLATALNRLKKQVEKVELLQSELSSARVVEADGLKKIKMLEDTIDCKDRDIDIIKDHHAREVEGLIQNIRALKAQLTQSTSEKKELNEDMQKLSKEKQDVMDELDKEKANLVEVSEKAAKQEKAKDQVGNLLEQMKSEMLAKDNAAKEKLEENAKSFQLLQEKMSQLEIVMKEKDTANDKLALENKELQMQKSNIEEEVKEIKKVHNELRLLRLDYEKAIKDIQVKEYEIQKLRLIQVQKLDQEEETRQVKKNLRDLEEALSKSRKLEEEAKAECKDLLKKCANLQDANNAGDKGKRDLELSLRKKEETITELNSTIAEKDSAVASLKSVILEKEEDIEKAKNESFDLVRDVEKKYKQFLDNAKKEKFAIEEQLASVKAELARGKQRSGPAVSALKTRSTEQTPAEMASRAKHSKSVTFNVDALDSTSDDEVQAASTEPNKAAGDFKFFTSRNKRSLEDEDYDTIMKKASSKTKTQEPKKRRMFFNKSKAGVKK